MTIEFGTPGFLLLIKALEIAERGQQGTAARTGLAAKLGHPFTSAVAQRQSTSSCSEVTWLPSLALFAPA